MIYSMNAKTLGVSTYADLSLSQLAEFNGSLYGVGTSGLVQFTGDDDEGTPISWIIETGLSDYGTQRDKTFLRAYMLVRSYTNLVLTSLIDVAGARITLSYPITRLSGEKTNARTVTLSRGVRGTAWGWRLEGTGPENAKLEDMEAAFIVRQRRH